MLFVVCFPPRSTQLPLLFASCLLSHPLNFTISYAPPSLMQFLHISSPLGTFAHHSSCYRFEPEDTFATGFTYFTLPQSKCFLHVHVTLISLFLYISRILHSSCDGMNTLFSDLHISLVRENGYQCIFPGITHQMRAGSA